MNLIALTETLVKSIASKPDDVKVRELPTTEDDSIMLLVVVDSEDMGRVLGKKGIVANSIRTIVKASAYNANKKVTINFETY